MAGRALVRSVAGVSALEAGVQCGLNARESELQRRVAELTSALGEAHVELRLLRQDRADFTSRSWR